MAMIPRGEGLGNRVADAQGPANIPTGANGEGLSAAVGAGLDFQQRRMDHEAAVQRQEDREAEAVRKANERARAVATVTMTGDRLQELHDDYTEQVKLGRVKREEVDTEWSRIANEHLTAAMEGIPPDHQQAVHAQLTHKVESLSRGVRKAVVARDQSETLASVNQTLESTQRMYLTNPKGAQELTDTTLDQLGPAAGLTSEQIRAKKQGWNESTRFNAASSMITGARRDNKALDAAAQRLNGPEFADLDPQKRTTLIGQAEGYRFQNEQRADMHARRVEAQAERQMKTAEAEFTAASSLINSGKVLDDGAVQRLTQLTAGTPYAAAVPDMLKTAQKKLAFGSMPVAQMDAQINGLRAELNTRGTNPHMEKQMHELEQIRDAAKRDYKEDALPAALERGIISEIVPLDTRSIAAATQGLAARVEQAQLVSTRVGQAVSPLLRTEAEQLSKLVAALPVEQRASAIGELSQAAGPQLASAIGRQIAAKDKALGIAISMGGDKTTSGRHASELVLRGAQAIKDKAIKEDNAAITGIRAQAAALLGDAVAGDAREQLIEASVLTYYGMGAEGSADLGRAVRLATGGVAERGGRKVLLPYGVPEEDFDKKLRAVKPADLLPQLRGPGPDVSDLAPPAGTVDPTRWGNRPDGSKKGAGFLGVLKRPDGDISTEISIGVEIGGKQMDIPTLVPTLTRPQVNKLLSLKDSDRIPDDIVDKAVDFARKRVAAGKSVFAEPNEIGGTAPAVYIDGKPMQVEQFTKQLPNASLVTVGNGRYHVRAGKSLATDAKGAPVVVEVK